MIQYDFTPFEPFTRQPKPGHPYAVAIEWARVHLKRGTDDHRLLVIGSTLAEAEEFYIDGWQVDYLDFRDVPWGSRLITVHQGDALALPFPDATFDAISSTCVYCHVGLGRYGDPKAEDAELTMLRECRRVLKPHGRMAMMTGPVSMGLPTVMGTTHRVTTYPRVERATHDARFILRDTAAYIPTEKRWRDTLRGEPWATDVDAPDYLCVALEAM